MLKLSSTETGERVDGKDLVMDIYKVVNKSILFTPMTADIRHRVTISLCYSLVWPAVETFAQNIYPI